MCLLALSKLKDDGVCPWNVLDMGTGSGILGIAAWKLWKTPVLAVDNDESLPREVSGAGPGEPEEPSHSGVDPLTAQALGDEDGADVSHPTAPPAPAARPAPSSIPAGPGRLGPG